MNCKVKKQTKIRKLVIKLLGKQLWRICHLHIQEIILQRIVKDQSKVGSQLGKSKELLPEIRISTFLLKQVQELKNLSMKKTHRNRQKTQGRSILNQKQSKFLEN